MPLDWFNIVLIVGFVHGVILFLAIRKVRHKNPEANRLLLMLIALISVAFVGRMTYNPVIIAFKRQLAMLPDFILFLFGPILYLYIKTLLTQVPVRIRHFRLYGIPALIHVVIILILFAIPTKQFITLVDSGRLYPLFHGILTLALIHNGYYWFKSMHLVWQYKMKSNETISFKPQVNFLLTLLTIAGICLVAWAISEAKGLFAGGVPDFGFYALVWLALSALILALGFFAISQPDILALPAAEKYQSSRLTKTEMEQLMKKLNELMLKDRLFLEPKLTKASLAAKVGVNSSELSRIVNEGFGKNFFDFVNAYRVEEFISLVRSGDFNHLTLLAIAKEAGFNSKTTFHTAFKKETGTTPRNFFNSFVMASNPSHSE